MSSFFTEKIKLLKQICCCKVLEKLKALGTSLKNKLISSNTLSDEKEFHSEKSYPT